MWYTANLPPLNEKFFTETPNNYPWPDLGLDLRSRGSAAVYADELQQISISVTSTSVGAETDCCGQERY
ncbi:unnamed protein product, partial [Brenthis ino]